MLARHISPFEGSPRASAAEYVLGGMFISLPQKNFLSLTIDFQPLNHFLQKNFKKTSKKVVKKFAELKKRRTFAPANETISALVKKTTRTLT